jgi:hypothetical protein
MAQRRYGREYRLPNEVRTLKFRSGDRRQETGVRGQEIEHAGFRGTSLPCPSLRFAERGDSLRGGAFPRVAATCCPAGRLTLG